MNGSRSKRVVEEQVAKLHHPKPADPEEEEKKKAEEEEEEKKKAEEEKRGKIKELRDQLRELTGEDERPQSLGPKPQSNMQQSLLQQLRLALEGKEESGHQQDILRVLTTDSNKTASLGGTSTLKPDILQRLNLSTPATMQD